MYRIKRAVLLVKWQQPFLDWTRSLPDPGDDTLESLNRENHVYLIPDHDTPEELEQILRPLHKRIFEMELHSWYRDPRRWPKRRNFKTFLKWFGLEVHSIVLNPYADAVEEEVF